MLVLCQAIAVLFALLTFTLNAETTAGAVRVFFALFLTAAVCITEPTRAINIVNTGDAFTKEFVRVAII